MYGIVEERENETWYMIRGKAFTPKINENYPIQTFTERKEAENAIYWLKYGKSVDIIQFKIIKVKNREIAPY